MKSLISSCIDPFFRLTLGLCGISLMMLFLWMSELDKTQIEPSFYAFSNGLVLLMFVI